MFWLSVIGTGLAFLTCMLAMANRAGKLEQRIVSLEDANKRSEVHHTNHYAQAQRHEEADQRHFADTDVHWNKREREWLDKRFVEMGTRFDTLEKMIRKDSE